MANPTRPSTSAPDTIDPYAKDDADQAHARALAAAEAAHSASAPASHETGLINALRTFMAKERAKASPTGNKMEDADLRQNSDQAPAASQGVADAPGNTTEY